MLEEVEVAAISSRCWCRGPDRLRCRIPGSGIIRPCGNRGGGPDDLWYGCPVGPFLQPRSLGRPIRQVVSSLHTSSPRQVGRVG